MSIVVRFAPESVTSQKYDETRARFDDEFGAGYMPDGCELHVAFSGPGGNIRVSEIWDSVEQFQAFGEKLMPFLASSGIEFSGEPEIFEVHNIQKR
jgi:hypothetical protein